MKNNRMIKLLIKILLTILIVVGTYIYQPNISYALEGFFNAPVENVGKINTMAERITMDKVQIHEHRGYGIIANGSATEVKTYEQAVGNTGISNIQSIINQYMSPATGDCAIGSEPGLGWVGSLMYNTSIFCQENGVPFPGLKARVFNGFHVHKNTNRDEEGTLIQDFVEWCPPLSCGKQITVYLEDYKDDGIILRESKMSEADIYYMTGFKWVLGDFQMYTSTRVDYSASPRNFNTIESYIFTYSLRNYYRSNPAQLALWKYKNGTGTGDAAANALFNSAHAVNELCNPIKPQMSVTTTTDANGLTYSTGTVLEGDSYKVGPIKMNGYSYGWTEDIKQFSGDSSVKNPENADILANKDATQIEFFKGIVAGIIEAKVKLDNGTEIVLDKDNMIVEGGTTNSGSAYYSYPTMAQGYEYPTPNSKFYIVLPISECVGATKIERITMTYKWHTADGNGGDLDGYYQELKWESYSSMSLNNNTTYHCDNSYGGYACVNDHLAPNDRSCYYGYGWDDYNVNQKAHDFWCGQSGYCFDGKSGQHRHCGGDCEECYGHRGSLKCNCHTEHSSSCKKKYYTCDHECDDDCALNDDGECKHMAKCDGDCTYDYYTWENCPYGGTEEHDPWVNQYNEGCYNTDYCSYATLDYCLHGHQNGKHTGSHNWSYAAHIEECFGPEGEGTRCNAHPDADGGGHRNCATFDWKCTKKTPVDVQKLIYVSDSQVYEHNVECYLENIPLITKVEIDKYVYDVEHAKSGNGINDNTFGPSEARRRLEETTKEGNPVYVETDDYVTYKIVLKNSSAFGVKVKIDDILPEEDAATFISARVGGKEITNIDELRDTIIQISANSEASCTVTIQMKALEGVYENQSRLITRNSTTKNGDDDIDYIRTIDDDGPIVNHIEPTCQGTTEAPDWESSDWVILNNYNVIVDKYIYQYDEAMLDINNTAGYTEAPSVTESANGDSNVIKEYELRVNNSSSSKKVSDGNVEDTVRVVNTALDTFKYNHPLRVEKGEKVTFAIKVINDAKAVAKSEVTGNKPATQVKPKLVIDTLDPGLSYSTHTAKVYNADGSEKYETITGAVSVSGSNITFDDSIILSEGEYIIVFMEVNVDDSNMSLDRLSNEAEIKEIANANDVDVSERNIAEQTTSKDYVVLKDLIIAGHVWVDFNKDGLMNDTYDTSRKELTGVSGTGRKSDILVTLHDAGTKEVLRETKTDTEGMFTFGRDTGGTYYPTFDHTEDVVNSFNNTTLYDRVDKANNKDNYGNYSGNNNYLKYYIQYSYDGMIYKSTEEYANQKHLNASTGAISDIKYRIDSNAAEIPEDRKKFNQEHEYISYNQSFDMSKAASSALKYNKEGHASYLVEAEDRVIKATSFIDETSGVIDNIWLYDYKGVGNPETEYLKHINLGLELREDVDIALSKDVYSLTTIVDGEMVEYRYNLLLDELNGDGQGHDYIIDKPYGIELYESDYKKRVDQYESEAVRAHKGIDSELNVDVTYRITLNNVPTTDDDTVPGADDKKLDVNIHEVLDLYDKNFMPYSEDKITVKIKNDNGFLEPVERTISEAWYFKEGAEGTKYRILNASEVALGTEEPFYVEDPSGTYGKVPMTVSNTSEFAQANNDYDSAGYRSMFIRTNSKDEIVLSEGEKFDIYVRYTLDKDAAEVKTTESAYNETKTENSIENKTIMIDGKEYTFAIQTFTETTTDTAILERSLNIAECAANKLNPRGTENIAQINAYSVYYTNKDYPDSIAALVDKDSNAGNVGDGEGIASSNSTSVDNVALYEDTTYKTGIEIIANNTENDLEVLRRKYGGTTITVEEIIPREIELKRNISGKVWDDSKVEATETNEGKIYHGDGSSKTPANKYNEFFGQKDAGGNLINEPPQTNINVEKNYDVATSEPQRKEQVDLSVRNAKAEFIEIVPIPKDPKLAEDDPKQEMHYYEQVLTDVTWTQDQQARTNANGEYNLYGLTPGRYIVRFTYGDTITDEDAKYVTSIDEATKDMQIFNGQDYKSTKYTLNLEDGERDVDKIIQRFMDEGTSDARDDEMRRLAVNQYSEIMTNQKAEVLKGLINNTRGLIDTRYNPLSNNTEDELKVLTDNTYMEAETVEFEIKQEKVLAGQVQKYITYGLDVNNGIYYDEQTIILNEHINERDFDIENVDFGIEYRPESQISLTKEINEMKLTAEDGTLLVDLYFYTTGEGDATEHHIDKEKSKGMDVVQFISNDYLNYNTNALVNKLASEDLQGFVYIQVDDEILQGATVEITYKFYAQNNSEIDLIRKTLDEIRYKENQPTVDLVNDYKAKGYDILDQNYTASGTAENVLFSDMYGLDSFTGNTVTINEYIKLHDDLSNQKDILSAELVKMANEQDITVIENCRNRILELDKQIRDLDARHVYRTTAKVMTSDSGENAGKDGYYGRYVGYAYYTADAIKDASNNLLLDTVACLKFDKILDYIDTDLEYITETNNDLLENRFWKVTNTDELKPYVYALRKGTADLTPVGTLMNREDQEYKALVVSVDDSLYDMNIPERVPANAASLGNGIVNNKDLSRFLKPAISTHVESDTKGFIYLPTSKVISAETGTDNLQYENLAEIVQFTTLTGRRTNFATTIGNADIHATAPSNKGSSEFNTAALEPDTAATETITLTPPTGLMTSRRAIVNIVDTTAKGVGVVTIIAAVVGIAVAVTTVTRLIIKKRRIK